MNRLFLPLFRWFCPWLLWLVAGVALSGQNLTVQFEALAADWELPCLEISPEGVLRFGPTQPVQLTKARLSIDGKVCGSLPRALAIAPGEHLVRVECPGFQPWESRISSTTPYLALILQPDPASRQVWEDWQTRLNALRELSGPPAPEQLEALREALEKLHQRQWKRRSLGGCGTAGFSPFPDLRP